MSPTDRASKLATQLRKEELKTAQWLLKDFQTFPARFGGRIEVEITDDEFSIIKDALEGYVWEFMKKLGYTRDQIGRFIHGRASWDQHMKQINAEEKKKKARTKPAQAKKKTTQPRKKEA